MGAPIALFVYARPDHARRTVDSLLANAGAAESDLFVFSDAAAGPAKRAAVEEVRQFVSRISGFRSVTVVERPVNYGLARSITDGVGQVLASSDRVIVLEDDMLTSPHFLQYMNDGLERFSEDSRVISVHGYVLPVQQVLPEAFFLRGADCWGWGTWRRGWSLFKSDGQALLDELTRSGLLEAFDFHGTYPYSEMLRNQVAGRIDSWAIRWYASAFLASKLTLYPGRSLVHNIGNDSSGTHAMSTNILDANLSRTAIDLRHLRVEVSQEAQAAFEAFFRRSAGGLLRRIVDKARHMFAQIGRQFR